MTVFTYNADARILAAKAALDAQGAETARIHLLPIPTAALASDENARKDFFASLQPGDLVFGYALPLPLRKEIEKRGAHAFDTEADATFIEENALLTAEATMGYVLAAPSTPRDLTVGIIGYGRIGHALCRMLLFFGTRVRIFTERDSIRTALGAAGVESRPIRYEAGAKPDLSGLDLLIQTAPAKIFTKENAPSCPLWNLAAASFVGEGVAVRQLSALPAKVCYESGGRALARAVLRVTDTQKQKTKG